VEIHFIRKEIRAMEKYSLAPDEGIVMRTQNVAYNAVAPYSHELILTNKNIIVVIKGLLGGTKNVIYLPLAKIKVIDNKAQVLVGKHKNGTARLEIYFTDGNVAYFAFNAITRMEATKWAGAIARLVLNEKENGYDPSAYAVPGAEKLAETIKGTMDTFKTVFNKKTTEEMDALRRSVFCQNCGATYEGIKGRTGKCPYCGTVQNIN